MKKVSTFEEFINESQGLSGKYEKLNDLLKAIKKLPDTIEYIQVPEDLSHFSPSRVKIVPKDNPNWRKEVENIVKNALKGRGGNEIDTFYLSSYYGIGRPTDPFYIDYSSQSSRDFADRMRRGEYGRLD